MKEYTYVMHRTIIEMAEVTVRAETIDEAADLAYENAEWGYVETTDGECWLEREEEIDEDND